MIWEAVITALVASFAPWTLLIVAGLLRRERPMHHALLFLASAAAVSLLVGFVVVESLSASGAEDQQHHRHISPAIDLGLGVAILLCVPLLVRRARRARSGSEPGTKPRKQPRQKSKKPWWKPRRTELLAVVALGAYAGSPSPPYLASLHSISKSQPSAAVGTLEVLLIVALFLLMAEVPILLFAFAPERTARMLATANAWLARNGRTLLVVAVGGIGCYFVVTGLVHLL